jgi:hypothetical protein
METFWAALVSSVFASVTSITVCLITNAKQAKANMEANKESWNLVNYRLNQIEAKQDKHNSVIERQFITERDIAVIKEQIADLKKGDDGR